MDRPVKFSSTVTPVCMPRPDEVQSLLESAALWVAGWGQTKNFGDASDSLQEVEVTTVNSTECVRRWRMKELMGGLVCVVGQEEGQGVCPGDSGGPLVARSQEDKHYLLGEDTTS